MTNQLHDENGPVPSAKYLTCRQTRILLSALLKNDTTRYFFVIQIPQLLRSTNTTIECNFSA